MPQAPPTSQTSPDPSLLVDLSDALTPVSSSVGDLRGILGSFLDDGEAYLVGSLASGLGNAKSDIDVHIFQSTVENPGAPMVFFLGTTMVDVVHYRMDDPAELLASLSTSQAPLAGSACAVGPAPPRALQVRLGRWLSAIPFESTAPPILPAEGRPTVLANMVRGAVEELVVLMAIAELIPTEAAGSAWRSTGRAVVEVLNRARGEAFVGRKWAWAKARRAGIPAQMQSRCDAVRSRDDLASVLDEAGLPRFEALDLVELLPGRVDQLHISDVGFSLVDGARLLPAGLPISGRGSAASAEGRPRAAMSIAAGAATLVIDAAALDAALSR